MIESQHHKLDSQEEASACKAAPKFSLRYVVAHLRKNCLIGHKFAMVFLFRHRIVTAYYSKRSFVSLQQISASGDLWGRLILGLQTRSLIRQKSDINHNTLHHSLFVLFLMRLSGVQSALDVECEVMAF